MLQNGAGLLSERKMLRKSYISEGNGYYGMNLRHEHHYYKIIHYNLSIGRSYEMPGTKGTRTTLAIDSLKIYIYS